MIVVRPSTATSGVLITALCLATDSLGDLVYVTGPKIGADYQVEKTDATDSSKMPAIGAITYKITPTRCVVQLEGEVLGQYTGLMPGRIYFVGLNSRPNIVPPAPPPLGRAYWQSIGVATSTDILKLEPIKDLKVRVA